MTPRQNPSQAYDFTARHRHVNTCSGKDGKPHGKAVPTCSSPGRFGGLLGLKNIILKIILGGLPEETLIVLDQFSGCIRSGNLTSLDDPTR